MGSACKEAKGLLISRSLVQFMCASSPISYYAMTPSRLPGEWRCDKRHGQGVCRFADGTHFRGQWEEDAWLQSAADPALSKVVGLTDALAGQPTSFTIQVQPCHLCSCCRGLCSCCRGLCSCCRGMYSLCSLNSLCSLCSSPAALAVCCSCGDCDFQSRLVVGGHI